MMYGPVGYKGHGRGFQGQGHGWGQPRHAPRWMGFFALFVLFMIFSKGLFFPLLLLFGLYMLFARQGRWSHWDGMNWGDYSEKYKNDHKRKNDDEDDEEPIYYV